MEHIDIGNPAYKKNLGVKECPDCLGFGSNHEDEDCATCIGTGEVNRIEEDYIDDKESYKEDMREDS